MRDHHEGSESDQVDMSAFSSPLKCRTTGSDPEIVLRKRGGLAGRDRGGAVVVPRPPPRLCGEAMRATSSRENVSVWNISDVRSIAIGLLGLA